MTYYYQRLGVASVDGVRAMMRHIEWSRTKGMECVDISEGEIINRAAWTNYAIYFTVKYRRMKSSPD